MNTAYQYLHFASYAAIRNWSVQYMFGNDFGYSDKYPLASIGSFLKRSRTIVDLNDDTEYKQVTVRTNNGGVNLRDIKKGKDIGTKKQNVVKAGQYIVSKIDARNGAFGIIPDELDGAIVTNDFPVFDVDNAVINTEFLLLVTTTKQFVAFAQSCSSGTTNRRRIDIDKFLEQEIPLPSLEEQNELIKQYNKHICIATDKNVEIEEIENEIDTFFHQKLCIAVNGTSSRYVDGCQFLRYVHSKNIKRWDCYHATSTSKSSIYNSVHLSEIVKALPMYGAAYKANNEFTGIRYIRITDINEDGSLNDNTISACEHSDQYLLKQNDFLIARSGNTVGKTFLYDEQFGKSIFAGYLIKFVLNEEIVNPFYLLYYTKTSIYKRWITENMRISAQPNINGQQYLNSPVILPPTTVQAEIVSHVKAAKNRIRELRSEAEALKVQALQDFERVLFKSGNKV